MDGWAASLTSHEFDRSSGKAAGGLPDAPREAAFVQRSIEKVLATLPRPRKTRVVPISVAPAFPRPASGCNWLRKSHFLHARKHAQAAAPSSIGLDTARIDLIIGAKGKVTGGVSQVSVSRMLDEQPRLFFLHFWANDDALKLAKGLGAALDQTRKAATLGAH